MTLAQLRSNVILNLGGRADKNDLINSAVNDGLQNACSRHLFRGLTFEADLLLTADLETVNLPATASQISELRLVDANTAYLLDLRDKSWVAARFPDNSLLSSSRPIVAYEENGVLHLCPKPNDAYTVRGTFIRLPTPLVADTDEAEVAGLDAALKAYATAAVMRSLEKFDEARQWDSQYERELAAAIVGDRRRPATVLRMGQAHGAGMEWRSRRITVFGDAFDGH